MSAYRGRFAPSPTGPLHFGSLVAALASWLDARAAGGTWRVRIEDVDETRTVPGMDRNILRTLGQLGLAWDGEVVWQSRRKRLYEAALDALSRAGAVYRCACSRREVADSAMPGVDGPVYPGTCRGRDVPARAVHAVRLATGDDTIAFDDRVQGCVRQQLAREVGDFVLRRRDGLHAYQLAVVVDDAEQGITDVVRGADLLESTPRQILLQRHLGYAAPRYLHVPVATNARGDKLSKQTLAPAIASGDLQVLRSALAFLGQPVPQTGDRHALLSAAVAAWDVTRIPRVRDRQAPPGEDNAGSRAP